MGYVWLFQMALRVLAAMQYKDDFNPVGDHTVKQGMVFYREASGICQEIGALGAHEWMLGQQPELVLYSGQVAFGSHLSPLSQAVLVNVFEVIICGRRNDQLMARHKGQLLISSNKVSSAAFDSITIPSARSS